MRLAMAAAGVVAALTTAGGLAFGPVAAAPAQPKTIGLVLTQFRYGMYETPDGKEECPAGMQVGPIEQFKALPEPRERLIKYGQNYSFYGKNGENADYEPLLVEEPIPWKEVRTGKSIGLNLDGTADGRATEKTCRHAKLIDPAGQPIDNQLSRAIGCIEGFRKGGFTSEFYGNELVTSPINRHLVEITGVDNEIDDPEVEVHIYKGRDGLIRRADPTKFVPFMSHRIDPLFPEYNLRTRGRIENGVLITAPIDRARFPILHVQVANERIVDQFTLRLKLTADGAEGVAAGYEPIQTMWTYLSKGIAGSSRYGPAGLYRAMMRYADGAPDRAGQCTAISAGYTISAVRALIIHPRASSADTTAAGPRLQRLSGVGGAK